MGEPIELHQTVHGYGDGHQLLRSSLDLTREQQWQLLVMSDLSGPSFRVGYDSYITGYPIVAGGFYCFAKTWYAHELPRPGCAWTHTLLISDTDVARIPDIRALLLQFRRPILHEDFSEYSGRISVDPRQYVPDVFSFEGAVCSLVLDRLYGLPSKTVVLASESSQPYEQLALALFNQQWPRLRRSFRFCSGALATREIRFDFAVAPPEVARQGGDTETVSIPTADLARAISKPPEGEWLQIAAQDLMLTEASTPFRGFVSKFGP